MRKLYVLYGDIILLIQPCAALAAFDVPERLQIYRGIFGPWQFGGFGVDAEVF